MTVRKQQLKRLVTMMSVITILTVLLLLLAASSAAPASAASTITVNVNNKYTPGWGYDYQWGRQVMVYGPSGYYRYTYITPGTQRLTDVLNFSGAPTGDYRIWVRWINCPAWPTITGEANWYGKIGYWYCTNKATLSVQKWYGGR